MGGATASEFRSALRALASAVRGSHSVVIGKVRRTEVSSPVHPLVYQDGRYTVGLADGADWVIPIAG